MSREAGDPRRFDGLELVLGLLGASQGGFLGTDSSLTVADFARLRVKQWGKFARKQGLAYREGPEDAPLPGEARIAAMLRELQGSGFPMLGVAGLLDGIRDGRPVLGFASFEDQGEGRLGAYRFLCTPLPRAFPELTFDRSLNGSPSYRPVWQARIGECQVFKAPPAPKAEPAGLLARSPLGRAVSGKLDDLLGSSGPWLHTADIALAERFIDRAYRSYDPRVFQFPWTVRGSWLVSYHQDGQSGLIDDGKRARFLDALPAVARLLD